MGMLWLVCCYCQEASFTRLHHNALHCAPLTREAPLLVQRDALVVLERAHALRLGAEARGAAAAVAAAVAAAAASTGAEVVLEVVERAAADGGAAAVAGAAVAVAAGAAGRDAERVAHARLGAAEGLVGAAALAVERRAQALERREALLCWVCFRSSWLATVVVVVMLVMTMASGLMYWCIVMTMGSKSCAPSPLRKRRQRQLTRATSRPASHARRGRAMSALTRRSKVSRCARYAPSSNSPPARLW